MFSPAGKKGKKIDLEKKTVEPNGSVSVTIDSFDHSGKYWRIRDGCFLHLQQFPLSVITITNIDSFLQQYINRFFFAMNSFSTIHGQLRAGGQWGGQTLFTQSPIYLMIHERRIFQANDSLKFHFQFFSDICDNLWLPIHKIRFNFKQRERQLIGF